jgi:hypothetical protein
VRENQPVDALEVDDVSPETGLSIVSQLGSFRQSWMDITLESRTMKFQPMKAAGLLLGHFEAQEQPANPAEGSAWVKIMDEDPKLARLLSIRFLQMRRST